MFVLVRTHVAVWHARGKHVLAAGGRSLTPSAGELRELAGNGIHLSGVHWMLGRHDITLSLLLRCEKMQICCISSNPPLSARFMAETHRINYSVASAGFIISRLLAS